MSFVRKSMLISGGQITGIALNTITNILLARTLGPNGVGQFEVFRTVSTLSVTLVTLGIGSAAIYFLNNLKSEPSLLITNVFKASLALEALATVGMVSLILIFPGYFGRVAMSIAVLFAVGSACLVGMYVFRSVLVAQMSARRIFVIDLFPRVILLTAAGLLAALALLNPQRALAFFALGNIGAYLLALFYQRRYIRLALPFDGKLFKSLLAYGLQLAAANVLSVLSINVTVLLLRYLRQDDFYAVGLYARAVGVGGMVTLIPTAIGPLLYSRWAGVDGEARSRQGEMAMRVNVSFGLAACVVLLIAGKIIIQVLYGERFIGANQALQILAPALVFMCAFNVCNTMLASDGRAMTVTYIFAGTVCVIAAVTWLSVPWLGIRGAALAVLCGNAFTAASAITVCARLYGLRPSRCILATAADYRYIVRALLPS